MTEHRLGASRVKRPLIPRMVRAFAIPIIFFWGLLAVTTNTFMPQVERVAEELAGPMVPHYAPSQRSLLHIGEKFHESNSTNLTMVVFEANRPLGDSDHLYYDDLMRRLQRDTKHVQYVMDLWGKPFTAAGAQSVDGRCTYVLLRLAGDIGQIQANQSVDAVRDIIKNDTPPPGLKVYVSGAAPLASDTLSIANASLNNVTIVTIILIVVMLLLVYRTPSTLLVPLLGVLIEMLVAKGITSTLGHLGYIELSSFAVNIVIALTLGAGTDYGIFLMGRYHEARQAGESREDSFYIAYRGVAPIIIGSGLTIAGACYCLTFARLNYFHTMGPAVAITMLFTIAAAMTLGPALLTVGSLFGMFDPRTDSKGRLYRRIGASVVRWPVPILVASSAIVMVGAIFVPTYRQNYDDRQYQPRNAPANLGFQAADRHFPKSKLFSEMLMIETDHDMRNSADFISLDRVAKALIRLHGVAMVQGMTRPLGRALEHASIPYLFTTQGSGNGQQLPFNREQNSNTDAQAEIQAHSVAVLRKEIGFFQKVSDELHQTVLTVEDLQRVSDEMNEEVSNLDDFFRPIKSYFYWEKHCFDIPLCWAFRSLWDTIDHIDHLAEDINQARISLTEVDKAFPQIIAQLKATADDTEALQLKLVNSYGSADLQSIQTDQTYDDLINVGNDFDRSRSDDYFYIPHEGFDNDDVKTGMKLMMSPDGKAARFIVTHEGDAMGPEGVEHVEQFPEAIKTILKETSLAGARIYIGGSGSNDKDIKQYAMSDLLIAAIAAFVLIFLIMLFITRSLVAALVIPGTVAFSYAGAFGLSILFWQHLIGLHLHWLVLPLTFIILVAVGSDYNLLLINRVKEELHGGIHTGLIRALGSTGGVVTSAGLVFAFTMLAMLTSELRTIGQVGSTVCIGLLLDTLIVRSFVVPSILRILGPWFWWPTLVRSRPLPQR
ncbi:RND family transporter [Mycobacterium avium subsp. paratuberculosis]|uniref:Membrane transport protein MMPL domain-containing protein n=7 Tax=Mycobacterium avium complex (MAC) TaxID=120793 RepID=Q73V83_MYCPA|nr:MULTISPECIES: RND family transporter [Mycobacterium avium complex (MAC)]ETA94771.1 membrane protein [Mycobacterium avium 05-4293]ETB00322.1 membrane protein [Mycobacterium avium 10-5581]ETB07219.1 membrane protein [Mycobacterium avium subsp. paratuberculosis 10-5864]ETB28385.1 membrane protein [Mycobacterium avium 09-5983]ETB32154.1 membrane protein [Mycobacterium avium subsp. hominissuis 10-4249]ETB44270.1 membrane protein [Mycobacterium avium subsp. hominissuis 10-5606]ETB48858.1 membra